MAFEIITSPITIRVFIYRAFKYYLQKYFIAAGIWIGGIRRIK